MIVMLALLNDGAILSIAYDNVHYKDQPEAWNMRMVLWISSVLGVIGVVAAFGLFYLGERVFHLDHAHIPVSYTHLRAHETKANLVCRLLLEKKKKQKKKNTINQNN